MFGVIRLNKSEGPGPWLHDAMRTPIGFNDERTAAQVAYGVSVATGRTYVVKALPVEPS